MYSYIYIVIQLPFTLAVVGDTLSATIEEVKQVNDITNHLITIIPFFLFHIHTSPASHTLPLPNPLPLSLPPSPPTLHTQEEGRHLKRQRSESNHLPIIVMEILYCFK